MRIDVYRDGVWAGTGTIDSEPQDAERYSGAGEIERPDGVYSWNITETVACS